MGRFLTGVVLFAMGMFLLSAPVFVGCKAEEKDGAVPGYGEDRAGLQDVADSEKKKIALTFDDGPTPGYTDQLLDGLAKRNVKATFFVLGQKAELYPELVKREADEGHLVGNHTYHHVQLGKVDREESAREIAMTNELIQTITGREVEYFRPPYGEWDRSMEKELDMIPVLWNVDPLDWRSSDVDEITEKIVTNVKENDIILMHDDYQSSVDAALRAVDILTERGYEFVTVDELIVD